MTPGNEQAYLSQPEKRQGRRVRSVGVAGVTSQGSGSAPVGFAFSHRGTPKLKDVVTQGDTGLPQQGIGVCRSQLGCRYYRNGIIGLISVTATSSMT